MKRVVALGILLVFAATVGALAVVEKLTVPSGTEVALTFGQPLQSKTAKVGDTVKLSVTKDVTVMGKTVLTRGTPVTGVVSRVDKRKNYGVNAEVMISLNPVQTTFKQKLSLAPRTEGKKVSGKKSGQAAGAAAGGAIVLGPVGLVGGYFIHGKRVVIKPGDPLVTVTSTTVTLTRNKR